jgi:ubiquinone biosynthesis protein UbiJ
MLKKKLLKTLTTAINKVLSLDPESADKLKKLDGKIIQFEISKPDFIIFLQFNNTGAHLLHKHTEQVDITVKGTAANLIKLSQQAGLNLYDSNVKIIGDMGLADEIRKILSQLELDWEGGLAEYTGDEAAHHIGQIARSGLKWLKTARENLHQDIKEYAQEEIRVLPTRLEMDHFTTEVTRLRNDTERMEARIFNLTSSTAYSTIKT